MAQKEETSWNHPESLLHGICLSAEPLTLLNYHEKDNFYHVRNHENQAKSNITS